MVESPRRRWHLFAISVLGLVIGLWGMQGVLALSVSPVGTPANPVRYPARVGSTLVGSPEELRFIAQSRPVGSILEVRSADGGVSRTRLARQLPGLHLALILLQGLAFLVVSLLVLAPRADRPAVRDLYGCALLAGVAVMIHGPYFPRSGEWTQWALPVVWIACFAALPVVFFRMTQTFPRERKFLVRRPGLMRGLWIAAAVLIAWQSAVTFRYFVDPRPATWQSTLLPRALAEGFLITALALGSLTLYRTGRRLELSREREQTKWLLWGLVIGLLPYALFRTLPKLSGLAIPAPPPELDRILGLAIPIAFTFAVVRHRAFDIDIIIRRSLIYGLLAGVLGGVYYFVGVAGARWAVEHIPRYVGAIQILAVALPVILYTPARRWIGILVDRTFYRTQYDYARALLAFQDAVRGAPSQEEIASLCRQALEQELGLTRAVVLAWRGRILAAAGELAGEDPEALLEAAHFGTSRKLLAAPNSTSRPDLESREYPEALARAGFRLAVPLTAEGQSLGVMLVGERDPEGLFVEQDLKLIHAIRAEATAALVRVEAVQHAAEEALARARAEELERLKSAFFSRVASDLKAPLSSIRWTVQNLLDGARANPAPEHVPQLEAVDAAASQLGRIVDNLLDLSRLEQVDATAEQEPVDLLPLVQEAVATVQPAARARNVQFDLSITPDLKPVRGDRRRLLDIVTHLLENAARSSPHGEAVDVTLVRNGEGQMLVIRDRGPGLSASARSYLDLMRGTIQGENHPDGGARFVCTIPEWSDAQTSGVTHARA